MSQDMQSSTKGGFYMTRNDPTIIFINRLPNGASVSMDSA